MIDWVGMLIRGFWTVVSSRYPHILVLEYGVDHAGEMDIQIDIVEPDVALFTKLSPSHTEGFGTVEKYYAEKEKLLRRKHKNTYAIANADDPHQADFVCQSWYGHDSRKSDLTITNVLEHPDGVELDCARAGEIFHIVSPILGAHHAGILAGAFLVAEQVDIPALDSISFLRHIHLPHARGNVLKGLHDSLVIDGTYNG